MARARLLKPGFFTNSKLASQPAHGRLLFAGLWTLADREGRLKDEPAWIRGQLFPYEARVPIDKLLNRLAADGFITRYRHKEAFYIQVNHFTNHQKPNLRESESTIPGPTLGKPKASQGGRKLDPVSKTEARAVAETVTPPRIAILERQHG